MSEDVRNLHLEALELNEEVHVDDSAPAQRILRERTKLKKVQLDLYAEDTDSDSSKRLRRKTAKKNYAVASGAKKVPYNNKGVLIDSNKDVCDCLIEECPGCHFPCPKCRSNKCGHECRQNRKWVFDSVENDGNKGVKRLNPHVQTSR